MAALGQADGKPDRSGEPELQALSKSLSGLKTYHLVFFDEDHDAKDDPMWSDWTLDVWGEGAKYRGHWFEYYGDQSLTICDGKTVATDDMMEDGPLHLKDAPANRFAIRADNTSPMLYLFGGDDAYKALVSPDGPVVMKQLAGDERELTFDSVPFGHVTLRYRFDSGQYRLEQCDYDDRAYMARQEWPAPDADFDPMTRQVVEKFEANPRVDESRFEITLKGMTVDDQRSKKAGGRQ